MNSTMLKLAIIGIALALIGTLCFVPVFGWNPLLLLVFGVLIGVVAYLGYEMAHSDILLTKVTEGRARNIEKAGIYDSLRWSFREHVQLEDDTVLHKKHLYDKRAIDASGAKFRDKALIQDDPHYDFLKKPDISFRVDRVRRLPQQIIQTEATIVVDGKEVKVPVELEMKDIKLDRNFNFMDHHGVDRDLQYFHNHVVKKPKDTSDLEYPDNFFDRLERGFYYDKEVEHGGKKYRVHGKLQIEEVLVRVNDPIYLPGKVVSVNHSRNQLFGGWYYMGFPWLYSPFRYHQAWISLKPTGEQELTDTKKNGLPKLVDILMSDDQYVIPILGAEDRRILRLDILLLIKLRTVNPRKAMYQAQKVLEMVSSIAGAVYRRMVSQYTFEEIISDKTKLGQNWWKMFQLAISDPANEWFFERYGIWILSSDLWKVDVHGDDERFKEEVHKIQTMVWKAEQQRKASITEAEGKAEATRIFFESVRKHGSDGLQILFMQTLEKLGEKDGKMLIPFGDIGRYLSGTIGKDSESRLLAAITAAGLSMDDVVNSIDKLAEAKATATTRKIITSTK